VFSYVLMSFLQHFRDFGAILEEKNNSAVCMDGYMVY